ncbi:ribonuclease P protein component [Williamsia sterculiae]|uniref:Ribonuclease P protein component n=1 Tax=Williamsia sterculiae TaxID=1344003 RepID=A0A1N7FG01_9NOCA|nr:ribonuclease P protein component [Williamsia sterculiae]SIR99237.1 ribonuclease P protein component [Williamsia sterculiae]
MLPSPQRISRGSEFTRTLRSGVRVNGSAVICYVADPCASTSPIGAEPVITYGGPRFGLIVSKSVGDAVCRHRVARRLRAAAAAVSDDCESQWSVVIRALPSAASTPTSELERQLRRAVGRARSRWSPTGMV